MKIIKTLLLAGTGIAMIAGHAFAAKVDGPKVEWNISL